MSTARTHQPLPGSTLSLAEATKPIKRPHPRDTVEVTLLLRCKHDPEGPTELAELGSQWPHERRHLTHDELAATRGVADDDLALVENFARKHALTVVERDATNRTVTLSGALATLESLFGVELHLYDHPLGVFRAHDGPVHVPTELASIVEGVFGLDSVPLAAPHIRTHPKAGGLPDPDDVLHYTAPQLADLYGFPRRFDGTGETIALVAFDGGYDRKDLDAYFGQLGLPTPTIMDVSVGGASNRPTGDPARDGEVMLDIEVAGSAATGARLVVYFAPNSADGWVRAIHRVVSDRKHRPSVLSMSWGNPEADWPGQTVKALEQAFEHAALLGITVCASSGDFGSAGGHAGRVCVEYPSSSPHVLASGGTKLTVSGGDIKEEVVWNELASNRGATGGGVSDVFAVAHYQKGAGVPPSAADGKTRGRGVPDVAANADPNSGYLVRVNGITTVSGGTSAAAPLWAALVARIDQALGTRVGYLNPLAYTKLAEMGPFRDITAGNNGAYHAGPGWDACTGWGSPNGERLLEALRGR